MTSRQAPDPLPPLRRLRILTVLREVSIGLVQRPGRSALTALGTVLGMGTLVAIVGLTATAQGQISQRFTVLAATGVTVEQVDSAGFEETGGEPYDAFPSDAERRVEALHGVTGAGVWWSALSPAHTTVVSAYPPGLRPPGDGLDLAVYAADPGAIHASLPTWQAGRSYDAFHEARAERVVVLGSAAARALGVGRLENQPAVYIGDQAFTVVGILAASQRNSEFAGGVLVPASAAVATWGLPKGVSPQMTIDTAVGAAAQIAREVPLALRPDHPAYFRAIAPPDPHSLEDNVTSDLTGLFLILAGISLIIGTFGIANTTLVAVLERVPEIGLRRAVGARPRQIGLQFLTESSVLGAVGGVVGTTLGIATVLGVSIGRSWTPVMPTWLMAAPVLGALTGLIAGLYPAWQATRVEPAEALRR